jgi:hypothetical protein
MNDGTSRSACFALLEALNPERTPVERKQLLLQAIEFAMQSTGHRMRDKPGAGTAMLTRFYQAIQNEPRRKSSIW